MKFKFTVKSLFSPVLKCNTNLWIKRMIQSREKIPSTVLHRLAVLLHCLHWRALYQKIFHTTVNNSAHVKTVSRQCSTGLLSFNTVITDVLYGDNGLVRRYLTPFLMFCCAFVFSITQADPLPPNQAFKPSVTQVDSETIHVKITMPKDYYVYRKTRFSVASTGDGLIIKDMARSPGINKKDDFFGEQSVWYGGKTEALISLKYDNPQQLAQSSIKLTYQGCQDGVICYPPQKVTLPVKLPIAVTTNTSSHLFGKQQSSVPVLASTSIRAPTASVLTITNKDAALLSEDEAFPFTLEPIDATTFALRFNVAEGYYLYRDKIQLTAQDVQNPDAGSPLADVSFRQGDSHSDEFYGEQVVYRGNNVIANLYLNRPVSDLALQLQFQGCAEKGVCYPVMRRNIHLENGFVRSVKMAHTSTKTSSQKSAVAQFSDTLKHNLWAGVGLLLIAGIALSFTPCVLPMLPILLGIITNQRKVSKPRAFMLSSAYGLGVATMMAVFGLVVAKTGINIQIIFQQPLWLLMFAGIFIAMGLAMLGVFNLAMPISVQNKVINWQNKFQDTNAASVFIVGALSTLVVGPCVAPPLIAVLAFISTTGDSTLGAVYLFSLGLGMSIPLVIFASLVTTIPKTGALSRLVTRIFAMLMFGVGLWLLGRLLPGSLSLMLWGVFMGALAWLFWQSGFAQVRAQQLAKAFAVVFAIIGGTWLAGGMLGNSNPLRPFTKVTQLPFTYVNNSAELRQALANSSQPVIVDLYADWCVSCQEVEQFTLTNPAVIAKLASFTLLKLDITDTNDTHRELLREYDLIGPPVMLFFEQGREHRALRHVGAIKPNLLLEKLDNISSGNQ